ncbi:MAG TPA: response regulator [Candidatus Binatia bacterium]|nr:response regulator [Candidatus Binatia bacterium]
MKTKQWILLAEDDEHIAELTMLALGSPDKVFLARDGLEALDCLYHRGLRPGGWPDDNPAVVLLDLKMPKVNGIEVLRQIKSDPRLKNIPVVMLTSSREESDLQRTYDLGANAYVVKPVEFHAFNEAIKTTCRFWLTMNETPRETAKDVPARPSFQRSAGAVPA